MIHAIIGLVRQEFLQARRYWLNAISGLLFVYTVFLLLFMGIRTYAGSGMDLGFATENLVVGYWVVLLTNMTFQNMMSFISFQAMTGMLEQLYLSPYSFTWLAFGKMLGSLFYSLTLYVPVLFLMMLTTGQWLHLDLLSIFPLILLLTAQAYGMGFMMGGLALLYKQINALGQPVVMLLVLFIAAPPDLAPFVRFVPLSVGWRLLRDVMTDGVPIWQLPVWDLTLVAIQAAVLCWGGWLVYHWCEEVALRRGVLGQY